VRDKARGTLAGFSAFRAYKLRGFFFDFSLQPLGGPYRFVLLARRFLLDSELLPHRFGYILANGFMLGYDPIFCFNPAISACFHNFSFF
jgi:hypothetical protein